MEVRGRVWETLQLTMYPPGMGGVCACDPFNVSMYLGLCALDRPSVGWGQRPWEGLARLLWGRVSWGSSLSAQPLWASQEQQAPLPPTPGGSGCSSLKSPVSHQ